MLLYNAFAIISLLFFIRDFFPYTDPKTEIRLPPPTTVHNLTLNPKVVYKPHVNRMVLIIIDALRTDFINPDATPFIYETASCLLKTRVRSPTVTLPRIKALTTGSLPQFMDVVFNLMSVSGRSAVSDGFLWRLKESGRKIVFYGDDTWLKMYEGVFHRLEGVSSFFVSDFEEVDQNVTRNVNEELERNDWDLMVLHYLGLDHIGHVYGPFNNLVKPKLQEMDDIIERIYKKFGKNNGNVILVTGDHGMKDSGGHGGSSHSEVHVPLALIGLKCDENNEIVEQTDVATTLSVLFGVDIPSSSVGKLLFPLLSHFSVQEQLYVLLYNSLVLKTHSNEFEDIFQDAFNLHSDYLKGNDDDIAMEAKRMYVGYLKRMGSKLLLSSSEQNVTYCSSSLILLLICMLNVAKSYFEPEPINHKFWFIPSKFLFVSVFILLYFKLNPLIIVLCIFLLMLKSLAALTKTFINFYCELKYLITFALLHSITFFSSSFIEEEHQFWYFSASSLLFYNSLTSKFKIHRLKYFVALCTFRFLRKINQTGDKFSYLPDLADWFLNEDNRVVLLMFYILSLIALFVSLLNFSQQSKIVVVLNGAILIAIFMFKTNYSSSYVFGRYLWLFLLANFMACLLANISLVNCLTLIFALLLKPYNVVLLPAVIYGSKLFSKSLKSIEMLLFVHIITANALYFCQGNSNSFASIDVAVGYIGLSEYISIFVMLQLVLHTYALPIMSFSLLVQQICDKQKYFAALSSVYLLRLLMICFVALIQRQHLFIWTVFSPKVLAETANFILIYVFIFIHICSLKANRLYNKLKKTY